MTAYTRLKKRARRALRHPSVPRIQAGFDPRGLVMMMRPLRDRDLTNLSPALRRQLDGITQSQTWHGGPIRTSGGRIFGIFIGGQLAGVLELHTPTPLRKMARISYWLSAASVCWKLTSGIITKFMDWVAEREGLRVFELKWQLDAEVADVVVNCIRLPIPGARRFSHTALPRLSSA